MASDIRSDTAVRLPVRSLLLLAAAVFAAITTEVLPVGLLPVISHDLHSSESQVGLLVSAYAVVVAVASVPLAGLIERWPRRRVLIALVVAYAVSNVIMAGADNYLVALGARLLGGLAHAGFFGAVFATAVSMAPPGRAGRAVAFVGAGNVLALAFGVPLGTALGTAVGWRWAFGGCACLMVLLAVLTLLVLPAGRRQATDSAHVKVLTAVRGGPILVVAAVVTLITLGHYTAYTYVGPLLLHSGVGINQLSLVLFGYGVAGIAGLGLAGVLVDRWPDLALRATMLLIIVCLLVMGLFTAATPTVAAVVTWGLAFGSLPTLIQYVALRAVPAAPDAAPAVVNATFNIGISGGALIGSRELVVAAPPVVALTGAALAVVALLLLTVTGRRSR